LNNWERHHHSRWPSLRTGREGFRFQSMGRPCLVHLFSGSTFRSPAFSKAGSRLDGEAAWPAAPSAPACAHKAQRGDKLGDGICRARTAESSIILLPATLRQHGRWRGSRGRAAVDRQRASKGRGTSSSYAKGRLVLVGRGHGCGLATTAGQRVSGLTGKISETATGRAD
jgi:hypothetical protein